MRRELLRAAFASTLMWACACARPADHEGSSHAEAPPPFAVERTATGEAVVVLQPEALAAAGIEIAAPTAKDFVEEVLAFGRIEVDASRATSLRAPLAGTLAAHAGSPWPELGAHLDAGVLLADLLPRVVPLTPVESADVAARLAEARAAVVAADALLIADRATLERARTLNAQDKGVSDQVVESAAAAVAGGEARLEGARAAVATHEQLLHQQRQPGPLLEPWPLATARAGDVIAVLSQPGESVEAGQELLRLVDLGELDAEVVVPPGRSEHLSKEAAVRTSASGAAWLPAELIGPAPEGDRVGRALRLRVRDPERRLRPGDGVTARLVTDAAPRPVQAVPAAALLRYASRTWVYVEAEPGRFVRRAVEVVRADAHEVLIAAGLDAGAKVVTVGGMTLLSQEQMSTTAAAGGEE